MDAGFHASGCAGPIGGKGLTIPPDRRLMHGNELWKTATLLYRAENLTGMPFFLTKKNPPGRAGGSLYFWPVEVAWSV